MKGFQFPDKASHSPGIPGSSYRSVCTEHNGFIYLLIYFFSEIFFVTPHAFSVPLLGFRPGSASPSGKPSGPGAPPNVGPLPGHYAPQVFTFTLK